MSPATRVMVATVAATGLLIAYARINGSTDQRINGSTDHVEIVSDLPSLDNSPDRFVYLRLPPCSSCTDTGYKAIDQLAKELISPVVVGLDSQPDSIRKYLSKIPKVQIVPWSSLPLQWRAILPGIYDCSKSSANCKRRQSSSP